MKPQIFIDGQVGTTGLQIYDRLRARTDLALVELNEQDRKNPARRAEAINSADAAILCLPDDAAREAVSLVRTNKVRVIDASSAHRTSVNWVYGLPEYSPEQSDKIRQARFISNPGCYPTGAILLLHPLVQAGILAPDYPVSVNATSGYSGGGRKMIAQFEDPASPDRISAPHRVYGLKLQHKHLPELQHYSGLSRRPIFLPSVGRFQQGMIVQVPLHLDLMRKTISLSDLAAMLSDYYTGYEHVEVAPFDPAHLAEHVDIDPLIGTNQIRLHVCGNDAYKQAVLVAVYDNLGKGASGAAVQNLELALGLIH